jgi:membrane peptidoglycan carboxypeptidase
MEMCLPDLKTERKEVISQATSYTMTRMMQGVVDYGTAAGLRGRLGISEMGGKTGTTNDNSGWLVHGLLPRSYGWCLDRDATIVLFVWKADLVMVVKQRYDLGIFFSRKPLRIEALDLIGTPNSFSGKHA